MLVQGLSKWCKNFNLPPYYILCKNNSSGAIWTGVFVCFYHAEVEAKGETDCLTEVQLENLVTKEDLVKVTGKHCLSGTYAFWYPEGEMSKTELETGQDIRLKTKGDGPFICKFDVQQSLEN